MVNKTGDILYHLEYLCSYLTHAPHTVNCESELIYIVRNYSINKLSKDMKIITTFIVTTAYKWRPRCVYWGSTVCNV